MSIDKNCGQHDQMSTSQGSPAEAHSIVALEQAALYMARLAIARWANGSLDPNLPLAAAEPPSSRALWYAQAQQNLQEWLGMGGFAQYDPSCADLCESPAAPILPAGAAPLAGSDTCPADTCID